MRCWLIIPSSLSQYPVRWPMPWAAPTSAVTWMFTVSRNAEYRSFYIYLKGIVYWKLINSRMFCHFKLTWLSFMYVLLHISKVNEFVFVFLLKSGPVWLLNPRAFRWIGDLMPCSVALGLETLHSPSSGWKGAMESYVLCSALLIKQGCEKIDSFRGSGPFIYNTAKHGPIHVIYPLIKLVQHLEFLFNFFLSNILYIHLFLVNNKKSFLKGWNILKSAASSFLTFSKLFHNLQTRLCQTKNCSYKYENKIL